MATTLSPAKSAAADIVDDFQQHPVQQRCHRANCLWPSQTAANAAGLPLCGMPRITGNLGHLDFQALQVLCKRRAGLGDQINDCLAALLYLRCVLELQDVWMPQLRHVAGSVGRGAIGAALSLKSDV